MNRGAIPRERLPGLLPRIPNAQLRIHIEGPLEPEQPSGAWPVYSHLPMTYHLRSRHRARPWERF